MNKSKGFSFVWQYGWFIQIVRREFNDCRSSPAYHPGFPLYTGVNILVSHLF